MWIIVEESDDVIAILADEAQLIRAVNAHFRGGEEKTLPSIFNNKKTDWESGEIRLAPIKVKIDELSAAEKKALKAELKRLMERL